MNRHNLFFLVALAALLTVSSSALAQAPPVIPMQGYVTDAEGSPLVGEHAFEVSIYGEATGGTALFTDQQMVDVDEGYFTFYVGRGDLLDLSLFADGGEVYLGVRIDDDAELTPRTELGTVPFAAYAQFAGGVDFDNIQNLPADLQDGDSAATAGAGLTDNDGTFDVDTATIQTRVTGTCQVGEKITGINADGTVACDADADTTYTAGTGLTLTGASFALDLAAVQAPVNVTCSAAEKIASIAADGSVTCAAVTDSDTTYTAGTGLLLTGTSFALDPAAVQAPVSVTCTAAEKIASISADGTVTCATDTDSDTTYTAGIGLILTGTSFALDLAAVQAPVNVTCGASQKISSISADGTVTCVADADSDTTYTAGAGLSLAGTVFALDPTTTQLRVGGSCAASEKMLGVNQDGSVICAADIDTDTNTTYTAGQGIDLVGGAFSADTSFLQQRVTGICPVNQYIGSINFDGTVGCVVDGGGPFISYGRTGRNGQAVGFNFDGVPGVVFEDTNDPFESGGFFANGNTAAIWSPADSTVTLDGGTGVGRTILALYDEDLMTNGEQGTNAAFAFSTSLRALAHQSGAYLSVGGVWTNTSDRTLKEDLEVVDQEEVLLQVANLPITTWSYISEEDGIRHMGPMAQDFYAAFGLGYDEASIPTVDVDGVALASIQALHKRNEELKRENEALTDRLDALEQRLDALER